MFLKYPRTPHLEGSRLQPGDHDHDQVSLSSLTQGEFVWEEKVDGANSGISFDEQGVLQLQSRGHVLTGGAREAQFNLFKQWATGMEEDLYIVLGERYIMYGEWCYARHSVFYDLLPHYFLEFDVYDKHTHKWLSTDVRHQLLEPLQVCHVPVVYRGHVKTRKHMQSLIQPSAFKSENWAESLRAQAVKAGVDPAQAWAETEKTRLMEGLYVKQELNGEVIGRYKYVRYDFVQTIVESGSHWADRPMIVNMLAPGAQLFGAPVITPSI